MYIKVAPRFRSPRELRRDPQVAEGAFPNSLHEGRGRLPISLVYRVSGLKRAAGEHFDQVLRGLAAICSGPGASRPLRTRFTMT
jgi:hypothetical protein